MGITTIAIYDDINNPKYLTGILIKDDGSHYKYRFSMDELLYKTKNSDTIENYEDDSLFLFDEKTRRAWEYDYATQRRIVVFDEAAEDSKKITWNGVKGRWITLKTGHRLFIPHGKKFEEAIKDLQNHEHYVNIYGKEFKGYKGYAAILKLVKERKGHVKAAFHNKDIGDIDLIWGTAGEKGRGLAHLIEHRKKQNVNIDNFLVKLATVVEKGKVSKDTPGHAESKRIISYGGSWVIIETNYDGIPRNWIITGFFTDKEPPQGQ